MQTLTRPKLPTGPSLPPARRRKGFSPFMLIGIVVTVLVAVGAGIFLVSQSRSGSHAAAANVNMNCTLIAPVQPLTAAGLATPWQLTATNPDNGPCNMANPNQTTFIQGAVIDPATGQISVYNPLVVDKGTQPAVVPTAPTLPKNAVVALWGGSNATNITLKGKGQNTLQNANCVNGFNNTVFGQFWYCNAPAFFAAANQAIQQGKLVVPALGTAKDGMPCPTVSDFSVVDMDPHDNVTTTYLVNGNGQTAQMTAKNMAALQNANPVVNGSDERLLALAIDGALGCTPWMAPDLADAGNMVTALPLNELQAAARQAAPQALIPNLDPMVLVNNQRNLNKVNLYRAGIGEPQAQNFGQANTVTYCNNMLKIAPPRIQLDAQFTMLRPSPDAAAANNLTNFLAQRFVAAFGPNGLNCTKLTGKPDPIAVQTDNNGVAIGATINGVAIGSTGGNGGGNGGTTTTPNCTVNGTNIANCAGTTTINGQNCTFSFANNTVNVACGDAANQGNNGNGQNGNGQPQAGGVDGGKGKRMGNGGMGGNANNNDPNAQP